MNDHEHDLDIVAALAERRSTDPGRAEELVRTCDVCAEAYHSHLLVLEAVASEPTPRLDDLERSRLRAAVWERLADDAQPSAAPPASGSSTPWWYRLTPVAAALVLVVGVAVALPQGGDDAADDMGDAMVPLSGESEGTESDGADTQARTETTGAADEEAAAAIADDSAESADTTAAEPEMAGGADGADDADRDVTIRTDSEGLAEAQEAFADRAAEEGPAPPVPPDVAECLDEHPDLDGPFLTLEWAVVGDRDAVFVAQGEPGSVIRVVVFAIPTCEVLAISQP